MGLSSVLVCALLCVWGSARSVYASPPSAEAVALQGKVNLLISAGATHYTIPPGDYHFNSVSFSIVSASHFALSAADGVTLWFEIGVGVHLVNCYNVSMSGFVIDYDPPCFAQGVILEYSVPNTIVANFSTDYPLPDYALTPSMHQPVVKAAFWDSSTTREVANQGNQFMSNSSRISGTVYNITSKMSLAAGPKPGDLITISPRLGLTYLLTNCSFTTTDSVTIHGGGNMGFVEGGGHGASTWQHVKIIRRPGSGHLLALNADGFHSSCTEQGPTLINSEISFTGDDFVNVHNKMSVLLHVLSTTSMYVIDSSGGTTWSTWQPSRTDTVSLYALNALAPLAQHTIVSVSKVTNATVLAEAKAAYATINSPPYSAGILHPWGDSVWEVTVTSPFSSSLRPFTLVQLDRVTARNAVVRNNYMHDGYSRVLLAKGIGMTVENNVFERARGLHVFSEQVWLEGDLGLHNIIVRNNTLTGCGSNTSAITVAPYVQNVTLQDNTINP